jgi:hypothetical protein
MLWKTFGHFSVLSYMKVCMFGGATLEEALVNMRGYFLTL